jgi:hypothetical protein
MNEHNTILSDAKASRQTISTDTNLSVEKDSSFGLKEEKRKRASKKDRSNGKYSQEDFLNLPRVEQYALAEKYWNGPVADFDDGTFQFSSTQFAKLCEKLGFRKGIVDTLAEESLSDSQDTLYIDRGRRGETVEKKYTLSKETVVKMDELLGSLGNMEKSKVLDLLLSQMLDEKLEAKRAGHFHVVYKASAEEILM